MNYPNMADFDESGQKSKGRRIMKKPVIGITCNYDYKDEVGMVSDMGTPGQD